MTKKERLEAIIAHYSDGKPSVFAKLIGVAPSTISSWLSRDTFDYDLLFAKCKLLSSEWLLTGNGPMLKEAAESIQTDHPKSNKQIVVTTPMKQHSHKDAVPLDGIKEIDRVKPIPLVTETAAAGFGNEHFYIAEKDVKEYYIIPKFRHCSVDFMIEVAGLSMYPHFTPGDIVACTILTDRRFIQWNKCHVIATREQGILVKRLMPGDSKNCLMAVSDNKDYPPFDIPLEEITGLALVVGSVSLE